MKMQSIGKIFVNNMCLAYICKVDIKMNETGQNDCLRLILAKRLWIGPGKILRRLAET